VGTKNNWDLKRGTGSKRANPRKAQNKKGGKIKTKEKNWQKEGVKGLLRKL